MFTVSVSSLSPDIYDERLRVGPAHELVGLEAEPHAQVAHRLHHRLLEEPLVTRDPDAVVVPAMQRENKVIIMGKIGLSLVRLGCPQSVAIRIHVRSIIFEFERHNTGKSQVSRAFFAEVYAWERWRSARIRRERGAGTRGCIC